MPSILEQIHGGEVRHFDAGQVVIEQGEKTNLLFFLIEGAVEVVKDHGIVDWTRARATPERNPMP